MKYAITMLLVCVGMFGAVAFSCGSAHAGPYTLEIVAQAGDIIDGRLITGFSSEVIRVGISDDREVAFFAFAASAEGSGLSLMTQRRFIAGAGKVVDGRVPQFGNEPSLDINGLGDVAYRATIPNVARGVFVNQNLLVLAGDVIDGHAVTVISDPLAINDAGTVLFAARPAPVKPSIYSQSELVADSGLMVDGFTAEGFSQPRINNAGDVAFLGHLQELLPGQSRAILSPGRVILKPGDSIEGLTVDVILGIGVMTDGGDVLVSISATGLDGENVVFLGTKDQILFRTGDIVAGIQVPLFSGAMLNNRGQFALIGAVDAPGMNGFFPDKRSILFVDDQIIISEGDLLDDKIIRALYTNFDMNDRGDLAFVVVFEDFSQAVVLATPNIPEPSSFVLAVMSVCALLVRRQRRFRNSKGP